MVPAQGGGTLKAKPLNFCLKYKPPTIAIIYELGNMPMKKYVHYIPVDLQEDEDIKKLADELCRRESVYLNPSRVSLK